MIFVHSILNSENYPLKLKEIIKLPDNSTNYTEIDQYNCRQGAKVKIIIPLSKYEHLTFHFLFPRLIAKLNIINFNLESQAFKVQISLVSKEIQKKFIQFVTRFDITYFICCGRRVERGRRR